MIDFFLFFSPSHLLSLFPPFLISSLFPHFFPLFFLFLFLVFFLYTSPFYSFSFLLSNPPFLSLFHNFLFLPLLLLFLLSCLSRFLPSSLSPLPSFPSSTSLLPPFFALSPLLLSFPFPHFLPPPLYPVQLYLPFLYVSSFSLHFFPFHFLFFYRTPLHEAAANGHVSVTELLLEKGSDPNARERSDANDRLFPLLFSFPPSLSFPPFLISSLFPSLLPSVLPFPLPRFLSLYFSLLLFLFSSFKSSLFLFSFSITFSSFRCFSSSSFLVSLVSFLPLSLLFLHSHPPPHFFLPSSLSLLYFYLFLFPTFSLLHYILSNSIFPFFTLDAVAWGSQERSRLSHRIAARERQRPQRQRREATPMHLAACEGHRGAVEALAAGGADVDPVDHEGDTPLHGAASRGHLLAVGALVGLGASTSRKNERGKTPQDLLGDRLGKSPAERVFSLAKECAADEKERMRNMQEEHEKQENDLREMKKKVDSKEAEAANLRKENGKLKQELHEMKQKCDSKEAEAANLRKENGKLKQELHEMKEKCDSKEAEAANLRKENGKLKQDLQENKNEIKLIKHSTIQILHTGTFPYYYYPPDAPRTETQGRCRLTGVYRGLRGRLADGVCRRQDVGERIEQQEKDLREMKIKFDSKEAEAANLRKETRDLRRALARSEERADYQDDQGRRNNLRFSGIPEEQNETWQQCQQKLGHLLQQHLNLAPVIERARRVGKPSHDKPRDIVAKFASFGDRDAVFKKKANFKNAPVFVFVHEDFCAGTIKARKDQMEQLKQARSEGKHAYFNYRKLVVTERSHPRSQPDSALPLQSRSSRASLSDPPSPMLRRPSTPAHNAPGPFASAPKTPEGASGNDTSPRQEDSLFSPLSQRLRSKQ
ncbi:putative myosin light chain kinase, smooth muscle-like [Penaeus vannamei]|uniref:Putative myosin light chain kinase, smooth muscle-like n=1 Tax=Penaeus vannamei TaxID=6689 RepID=A0A3R7P7M8_PENVA|nr:putative myosin light chain kinase, smooth muscle-like [Penaeus vannamei]